MQKKSHHLYSEKDIKKEYKFWDTQLVPHFKDKENPVKIGPIKTDFKEEEIKNPIKFPEENMEWVLIDTTKEEELKKIYDFLFKYYYEEDKGFQEQYSLGFLKWQFSPIKSNEYENLILSVQKNGEIIGFLSGLPLKLIVYGKELNAYTLSFFCIMTEYRGKKLAQAMIKEMFRRTYEHKVFQSISVSRRLVPKPFAECRYYYANLKETIKKFEKPKSFEQLRLMEAKDVKSVFKLISENQKQFKIYRIFSEDEIEYWFMPRKDIIYSYVKEDQDGNITDFTCFYVVDVTNNEIRKKWCYIYYNIATSISSDELFENSLLFANQNGIDIYVCNTINNYESLCQKHQFSFNLDGNDSYGTVKYYFNNFICPETDTKEISIIII